MPDLPDGAIVVFTRAPDAGRVKTRLTPPLSAERAAAVHEASLRDVVARARAVVEDVRIRYDPSAGSEAWFRREFEEVPRAPQGEGNLGARLASIFEDTFAADGGPRRPVVIGADSPTLPVARPGEALAALHDADVVLGPARDGGYYLVGIRREAWPRAEALFRAIPWSTGTVLRETRERASDAGLRVHELQEWYDIDDIDDLRAAAEDAAEGSHLAALLREETLPAPAGPPPVWRRGGPWKILAAVAVVAGLALAGPRLAGLVAPALEWIRGFGRWAPAAFIVGYAAATVSGVPASLLTLAAGAVFGIVRGTAVVWVGATIGASVAFLAARRLARAAVERRLRGHRGLAAFDEALGREGGRIVFLLRLSPIVPFTALNYALGLSRVRFRGFLLGTVAGMLPGTFLYVYAGHVAGTAAAAGAGIATAPGPARIALTAVGFAATVAVVVLLTRAARRALARAASETPEGGDRP